MKRGPSKHYKRVSDGITGGVQTRTMIALNEEHAIVANQGIKRRNKRDRDEARKAEKQAKVNAALALPTFKPLNED